jgi:hypothetical protein
MRRAGLFWGIALVVVGILLLLNTLGILRVNVWGLLWPTMLIVFGVSVLWRAFAGPRPSDVEQVAIPLEGASRARVKMEFGAGRLNVSGDAGPNEIVSGSFEGGLDYKSKLDGDTLTLKLRTRHEDWWLMPWMWAGSRREWTVQLNPQVPLALEVEAGASESHLDLSRVRAHDIQLEIGASSAELTLPAGAGNTRATIEAGAATMKIRVPPGVAARIQFEGGASTFQADPVRFPRTGAYYQSPDYDSAPNKVDLHIEAGAGTVKID